MEKKQLKEVSFAPQRVFISNFSFSIYTFVNQSEFVRIHILNLNTCEVTKINTILSLI